MLYCYVYITGWDYNLFIWQLYNILLCDYTVIIHTPMPLTFYQKKTWKRLLSGFTVINSDVYVCVCVSSIKIWTLYLYFPPLYTPAHALCYFPKSISKACTLAGIQGSSTEQ